MVHHAAIKNIGMDIYLKWRDVHDKLKCRLGNDTFNMITELVGNTFTLPLEVPLPEEGVPLASP